jgi:hypothetical protein
MGNKAEARSLVPEFFPENIYTHQKGRVILKIFTWIAILILIV